jgi:hypothetical protein
MALVVCPNCKQRISDMVINCTNCGTPMGTKVAPGTPTMQFRPRPMTAPPPPPSAVSFHRSVTVEDDFSPTGRAILGVSVLGLLSLGLLSPVAWIMCNSRRAKCEESGLRMGGWAETGHVLGILGTVLLLLLILGKVGGMVYEIFGPRPKENLAFRCKAQMGQLGHHLAVYRRRQGGPQRLLPDKPGKQFFETLLPPEIMEDDPIALQCPASGQPPKSITYRGPAGNPNELAPADIVILCNDPAHANESVGLTKEGTVVVLRRASDEYKKALSTTVAPPNPLDQFFGR